MPARVPNLRHQRRSNPDVPCALCAGSIVMSARSSRMHPAPGRRTPVNELHSLRMRTKRSMQTSVVSLEMARQPRIEPRGQVFAARHFIVTIKVVDQALYLIEQALVILLVLRQLIVTAFTHETLFQREMSRDGFDHIVEESRRRSGFTDQQLVIDLIDLLDQVPVLVIDVFDPDAVVILPPQ
jgi:hypothetical protein